MRFYRSTITAIFCIVVVGCATQPIGSYEKFAQAGLSYSASLNELLVVAQKTAIDSNSAQLIATNMDADRGNREFFNQEINSLAEFNKVDEGRIMVFNDIRKQSAGLGNYFKLLNQLATTDEAEKTSAAIQSTANAIDNLSTKLNGQTVFALSEEQKSVISTGVTFIINAKQRKELKDAIERDETILQVALNTQRVLLSVIGDDLAHNAKLLNLRQAQMLLETPLTAAKPLGASPEAAKKWMDNRRSILTTSTSISEIKTASKAAKSLQDSLRKLLKKDESFNVQLSQLLTELESIHTVIQALN